MENESLDDREWKGNESGDLRLMIGNGSLNDSDVDHLSFADLMGRGCAVYGAVYGAVQGTMFLKL